MPNNYVRRGEFDIIKNEVAIVHRKVSKVCENDLPHIQQTLARIETVLSVSAKANVEFRRWLLLLTILVVLVLLGTEGPAAVRILAGLV